MTMPDKIKCFILPRADKNQPITRKVTICGFNEKQTELDLKLCVSWPEQKQQPHLMDYDKLIKDKPFA